MRRKKPEKKIRQRRKSFRKPRRQGGVTSPSWGLLSIPRVHIYKVYNFCDSHTSEEYWRIICSCSVPCMGPTIHGKPEDYLQLCVNNMDYWYWNYGLQKLCYPYVPFLFRFWTGSTTEFRQPRRSNSSSAKCREASGHAEWPQQSRVYGFYSIFNSLFYSQTICQIIYSLLDHGFSLKTVGNQHPVQIYAASCKY